VVTIFVFQGYRPSPTGALELPAEKRDLLGGPTTTGAIRVEGGAAIGEGKFALAIATAAAELSLEWGSA